MSLAFVSVIVDKAARVYQRGHVEPSPRAQATPQANRAFITTTHEYGEPSRTQTR